MAPLSLSSLKVARSHMLRQRGQFKTQHASKYLQQLCKHFAHKVDVTYDLTQGDVDFPFGKARLQAREDAIFAEITGESEAALASGRAVIDVHLKTFAFRESFEGMDWQAASGLPPQS
ncbi:DUF2218 domain-containing protein [Pseudophaeobacter leonis]|uniref:DUF2218 domain-containing protein n=1 Tax=Pseudophaeobacter leonis TaxID=1144477 RepID=UPI0030C7359F